MNYDESLLAFESAMSIYESTLDNDHIRNMLLSNIYEYLGRCHSKKGNVDMARQNFKLSIQLNAANTLSSHMLASLDGDTSEEIAPATYVSKLFDDYSNSFESSLRDLKYVVPLLITSAIHEFHAHYNTIVDLGSGTGLLGGEVMSKQMSHFLIGIDLSQKMLLKSIDKSCYNLLVSCDILDFLSKMAADKMGNTLKSQQSTSVSLELLSLSEIVHELQNIQSINLFSLYEGVHSSLPSAVVAADVFGTCITFYYYPMLKFNIDFQYFSLYWKFIGGI